MIQSALQSLSTQDRGAGNIVNVILINVDQAKEEATIYIIAFWNS